MSTRLILVSMLVLLTGFAILPAQAKDYDLVILTLSLNCERLLMAEAVSRP